MTHWPQITVIAYYVLLFAVHCSLAGEPRTHFNPALAAIGIGIDLFVLYWGGFFSSFGWSP